MKTAEEYLKPYHLPYKDPSDRDSYSSYRQGYSDAMDIAGQVVEQIQKDAYNEALTDKDNYAMGFAKWVESLSPSDRVSVWSKNGAARGLFNMDMEQLLRKYKSKLMI